MRQLIQDSIFKDAQRMHNYVSQASNQELDTRMDRLNQIYRQLRQVPLPKSWTAMPGLRSFLEETCDENPYVPYLIKEVYRKSRDTPSAPRRFIEQWKEQMGKIDTLPIDPDNFIAFIDALPSVRDAFAVNNRHNDDYYYTKYAEWYITTHYARRMKARTIVDVGAAFNGFARTITSLLADCSVTMLDMAFKEGMHRTNKQITCLGTDAADMSAIETGTVDLVCMHNSFEHFAGDSDILCLREISRILRPGGIALITPFFFAFHHSITVNPAACFLFEKTDNLPQKVCEELSETNARLDYNHQILSPYARRYDLKSTRRRILGSVPQMSVRLRTCAFEPQPAQAFASTHIPDITCRQDLFEHKLFYFLELSKP